MKIEIQGVWVFEGVGESDTDSQLASKKNWTYLFVSK